MLLVVFAMLAILVFAYPLYVMMPFRAQGASQLAFSLWLRKWAPAIATATAAGAVTVAILRWRVSQGRGQQIATAFCAATAVTFAALTYVNIYEKVFHGVASPSFVPAGEAALDVDDMVLSVDVEGVARAYPVRMMGYHHMVNDLVGGVPLVATY